MKLNMGRPGSLAAMTTALTLVLASAAGAQAGPTCVTAADPPRTGVTSAPGDLFADPALFSSPSTSNDYHWMHSSVHLQGNAAKQKWGACLFFNPDQEQTKPVDMSDWRSALVVNNPSPTATATVKVTYRDPQGNVLGPGFTVTLAPEATLVRGAIELRQFGRGIGSVEVTADHPIVGATLHHFGRITLSDGQMVTDPDVIPFTPVPGANSMQQIQVSQDASTVLYGGPFPISNIATEDFLNGVLPLTCVLNPNPDPVTLTVASLAAPGTPLITQTVPLPGFGMFLDTSLWGAAEPFYLTNPAPFDFDFLTLAFTAESKPILGDWLMVDIFGNGAPSNLVPGGRFRMGSGMLPFSPATRLHNPEHVETGPLAIPGPLPSTPPVETMMSIANVSFVDIGPVTVEFFPRAGGVPVQTLNFPTMPSGTVQRITPALAGIPENFAGWARITACGYGLVGWTMREVWQQTSPAVQHFRKVYGEELDGGNGLEPGSGFPVQVGSATWIRKVAPLLRAGGNSSTLNWWPSYVNAVNHASSNIGPYWHRFFDLPGTLVGQFGFAGLMFGDTSFTYVDPIANPPLDANISGRFDRQGGSAIGMEAIGDPLQEWRIPLFLGSDVEVYLSSGGHEEP